MKTFGEKKAGVEYRLRRGGYGVLIEDGRIGVVKSAAYDDYFLIGGGIDEGETEIESLRRETREEIGRQIEIGAKVGAALEYFYSEAEGKYTAKECHFYRVRLAARAGEKGKHELVWIAPDEIDRMHHECYRWILAEELKKG